MATVSSFDATVTAMQQTESNSPMILISILIIAFTMYDYLKGRSAGALKTTKESEASSSKNRPQKKTFKPTCEPSAGIKSYAVMDAATAEINEHIHEHGSISDSEVTAIIAQKKAVLDKLWSIFPGAMTSKDVLECYKKVVEPRGYTDENTLFAQSVCPDEVNHEEGDVTDLFIKYHGECFHAGGLGGFMFTGKVGFGAFSHHVPDGGHCALMYAPHIGLDDEGNLGAYSRDGQAHSGSCCGAAVGAYKTCMECNTPPPISTDPVNFQFEYIVNQVAQRKNEIVGNTECEKQGSLARLMYRIGNEMLEKSIGLNFGDKNSTLVVLTGIQINMPRPFDDFFLPMDFYIMHKNGKTENVFEEAFGPRS